MKQLKEEQGSRATQFEVKKENVFEKTKKSLLRKYGEHLKKVANLKYEEIQRNIIGMEV